MSFQPVYSTQSSLNVATAPALQLDALSLRYGTGAALEHISCAIRRGEQIAVVGPNGAGKSSLFKVIAGLEQPQSGQLRFPNPACAAPGAVAYIPQRSQVDWRFPVSVFDVVMMGRTGRVGLFRRPGRSDRARVLAALDEVQMGHLAQRQISELSGGQQQRVFIARALAQEASLLLMDEPLTGLDLPSQDAIFAIFAALRDRRVTVLTALHDLQLAARHFDRVMLLNRRLIGFGTPAEVFTPTHLMRAYGGHLHLAVTDDGVLTVADTCCDHDEVVSHA
jgi:ABC-type Mn2+/Zn2+ transport system ATPase subunit